MNGQVSDGFLHALVAISSRYIADAEGGSKTDQATHHLSISEQCTDLDDMSLEAVQTLTLQAMCLVSLGRGTAGWIKIGMAIRMAQGMELHRQAISDHASSALDMSSAGKCTLSLYAMDRFSVCGSNRPMMVSDDWVQGSRQPRERPGLSAFTRLDQPSVQHMDQGQIIHELFVDILSLLGQSTQYLQKGGVQGDSHFPWHQHSILSKIVGELTEWKTRVDTAISFNTIDYSNSVNVNWLCLSWFSYHAILVRLYRQFLPLIMVESESDYTSDPWQKDTSRTCVEHAISMAELCDEATGHGYSWPFFTSFCLASAATVLIHAQHYDFVSGCTEHLVTIVERLIAMLAENPLVELQLEMLRRMYKCHSEMIVEYCSGTLMTTNLDLTQFYKRYPKAEFDPSHIPFTQPSDWMDSSLDGGDDLFSLGSLPEKLSSLRGSPYTFQGTGRSWHQTPRVSETSERLANLSNISGMMSSVDDYLRLDDENYTLRPVDENQSTQACEPMDEELLKSLLEYVEGDCVGGEYRD
ncbi:hypothetical protein BHE90_011154 [Fusarium euwallaceae]|uniref:Xylanolytic transcriptional activator regulatory domain-containing protein n=1 Tax=Fusarium euwallaceae TaxID=1147111 RepID=A0A430LFA1_9HYPO|nr:hypothetical protein BHE90_011154 [Fusarium euwallaceae]